MTELPKFRSSLSTKTGTTTAAYNPTKAWTTGRCHRLLRPLSSKLQALRSIVRSNPSVTTENAARPRPKRDPTDPDALFVEAAEKAAGTSGMGVRRARARPQRTYSGASGSNGSRNHSNHAPAAPGEVPSINIDDSYLSIWGDPSSNSTEPESQSQSKRPHQPKAQDPNDPRFLLHSLRSHIHPSIFCVYLGIYAAFESVLLLTKPPPFKTKVLPLRTLAARKIAHCILATSGQVESDDIWYDAAAELGSGSEYLRDVVRWHAIELVRECIADGLMKGRQGNSGGIGMAGVLIGLCRSCEAEQEAQSLLQTLFDLSPVISSSDHPPILTLQKLWFSDQDIVYRFLAQNFPVTQSNPSWLGSTDIRKFLQLDLDENPGLEVLTTRALEAAFGLFGEEHISALSAHRQKASKRKGVPRTSRASSDEAMKKAAVMPYNVATKAENTILKTTRDLVPLSLYNPGSEARGIMKQLVRGFLIQDAGVKSSTEDVWGENWPVAAKVAILLQGLGSNSGDDNLIMDELAGCLEDICISGGKHAFRSLAEFIAECYIPLYSGAHRVGEDPIQQLSGRLLALASVNKAPSSSQAQMGPESSETTPETPRNASGMKMVTFTPGKPELAPHQERFETKRFLVAQLALQIAVTFSVSEGVKSNTAWIDWLGKFEHKVIGLKIQTPGRVKNFLQPSDMKDESGKDTRANQKRKNIEKKKEKRKGWRYEEGLDLWVAIGATPGRKESRRGLFMECVEIEMPDEDYEWRDEYEMEYGVASVSSDAEESPISEDESEASIVSSGYGEEGEGGEVGNRPATSSSSSSFMEEDSDEDADYYSNLRVTPPRTVRRSPRGTARIKKSLAYFSAIKSSSPMFTRTPLQTRSSGPKRQYNFSVVVDSSPFKNSSIVSSTIKRLGIDKDDWEDEDQDIDSDGVVMEDYSSPVLRRMERRQEYTEDDDKTGNGSEEEEEVVGDISFGDAPFGSPSPYSSPNPLPTPTSKRKREAALPLSELMDQSSSEEGQEFEKSEGHQIEEFKEDHEFEGFKEDGEYRDPEMEDEMSDASILPSSPPPPSPPPFPRPPKRNSLGALRSMVNMNDPLASSNISLESRDLDKILERSAEKRRLKKKRLRAKKKRKTYDSDLSDDELGR